MDQSNKLVVDKQNSSTLKNTVEKKVEKNVNYTLENTMNIFNREWRDKGLIVTLVKILTILYAVLYLLLYILSYFDVFKLKFNTFDDFTFNYLIPALQFVLYGFVVYEFIDFRTVKEHSLPGYDKFKSFIFYLALISLLQTIFHFIDLFRKERKKAELERDIEKKITKAEIQKNKDLLDLVNDYVSSK